MKFLLPPSGENLNPWEVIERKRPTVLRERLAFFFSKLERRK